MKNILHKSVVVLKEEGIKGFLDRVRQKIKNINQPTTYDFYSFITYARKDEWEEKEINENEKLRINWVIPAFNIGSGGHMTIFRMIHYLDKWGHQNYVTIVPPYLIQKKETIKELIDKHFINIGNTIVYLWGEKLPPVDIAFATSWHTAYYVDSIKNTYQKFYFVQDYEPIFYPMSAEYLFAEATYSFKYKYITAGKWLCKILKEKYGVIGDYFELGFDPQVYNIKNIQRSKNTIVFYARRETPRRAYELGVLALKLVKEKRPETEIIFFGSNLRHNPGFSIEDKGVLSSAQLSMLYNYATVGVVFSLTNYSLIPLEMLACGLPVIELKSECNKLVFEGVPGITLVEPDPFVIAERIIEVIDNPSAFHSKLYKEIGKLEHLTWEKQAEKVEKLIYTLSKIKY